MADNDWAQEAVKQLLERVRRAVANEYARLARELWG